LTSSEECAFRAGLWRLITKQGTTRLLPPKVRQNIFKLTVIVSLSFPSYNIQTSTMASVKIPAELPAILKNFSKAVLTTFNTDQENIYEFAQR
jgi:hypothetical protein